MSKEKATSEAIATVETGAAAVAAMSTEQLAAFLPTNREQLEMMMELNALEKTVESLGEKTTKPTDLIESGVTFDIIDAWFTELRDGDEMKGVVCFQIEEHDTGIVHIVMQGRGSIRDTYANYFGAHKALGFQKKLANYRMVWSTKEYAAGNRAAILERVRPGLKSANA